MSPRSRRYALGFGAALVAAATTGWFFAPKKPAVLEPRRVNPLAIAPPGPALLVTFDLARLREAAPGRALLGQSLAKIAGTACDAALATTVDALALAMPGDTTPEHPSSDALALIGAGHFRGSDVASCAEARVRAAHGDPVRTTLGSFISVRDRRKTGEVLARDGLLVVSEDAYLRELVDTADGSRAEGNSEQNARDELHAELRRVVGHDAPVIATLVLPSGWLARTLGDPTAAQSPLAAIRSAALRVDVTNGLDVNGLVACDGADACAHLERFFNDARSDFAAVWPDGAPLLAQLRLARTDARLELHAHLTPEQMQTSPTAASAGATLPSVDATSPHVASPPSAVVTPTRAAAEPSGSAAPRVQSATQ